jgi:hypothetical protein
MSTMTASITAFCETTGESFSKVVNFSAKVTPHPSIVGTVVAVINQTTTELVDDSSGWEYEILIDSTSAELMIRVTGEDGKNIKWIASVKGSCTAEL